MDGLFTFIGLTAIRIILPIAALLAVGTFAERRRVREGEGER